MFYSKCYSVLISFKLYSADISWTVLAPPGSKLLLKSPDSCEEMLMSKLLLGLDSQGLRTNEGGEQLRGGASSSHKRRPRHILAELQVLED